LDHIHIPALRRWTYRDLRGGRLGARPSRNFRLSPADDDSKAGTDWRRPDLATGNGHHGNIPDPLDRYMARISLRDLLDGHREPLNLLVRAKIRPRRRHACGSHYNCISDFPKFSGYLHFADQHLSRRFDEQVFRGCLWRIIKDCSSNDSVISLRGVAESQVREELPEYESAWTLEVCNLVSRAHAHHGLRRISHVSTVA